MASFNNQYCPLDNDDAEMASAAAALEAGSMFNSPRTRPATPINFASTHSTMTPYNTPSSEIEYPATLPSLPAMRLKGSSQMSTAQLPSQLLPPVEIPTGASKRTLEDKHADRYETIQSVRATMGRRYENSLRQANEKAQQKADTVDHLVKVGEETNRQLQEANQQRLQAEAQLEDANGRAEEATRHAEQADQQAKQAMVGEETNRQLQEANQRRLQAEAQLEDTNCWAEEAARRAEQAYQRAEQAIQQALESKAQVKELVKAGEEAKHALEEARQWAIRAEEQLAEANRRADEARKRADEANGQAQEAIARAGEAECCSNEAEVKILSLAEHLDRLEQMGQPSNNNTGRAAVANETDEPWPVPVGVLPAVTPVPVPWCMEPDSASTMDNNAGQTAVVNATGEPRPVDALPVPGSWFMEAGAASTMAPSVAVQPSLPSPPELASQSPVRHPPVSQGPSNIDSAVWWRERQDSSPDSDSENDEEQTSNSNATIVPPLPMTSAQSSGPAEPDMQQSSTSSLMPHPTSSTASSVPRPISTFRSSHGNSQYSRNQSEAVFGEGITEQPRSTIRRPTRSNPYHQSHLRGHNPQHAAGLRRVRYLMNEFMKIKKAKDIRYTNCASMDEVTEFELGQNMGPDLNPMRPFLDTTEINTWNHQLCDLFIEEFGKREMIQLTEANVQVIEHMFLDHLDRLGRTYREYLHDSLDQIEAKREKEKRLGRKNRRRTDKYHERLDICYGNAQNRDGSINVYWKASANLVESLGTGGMSSEESGWEDERQQKRVYWVKRRLWRAN